MKIMLINHYAGSDTHGMEYRPFYMAREWVKLGHDVTIVAADFSHLRSQNPQIKKDFTEESIQGIRYVWVKTNEYQRNDLKRVRNMWTFYRKIRRSASMLSKKYSPDMVIASSTYPFDSYAAKKIAKFSRAAWAFEIHDLWPLTPIELFGWSEKNPAIRLLQRAEDFSFHQSDLVVSILPDADKHMADRGADCSKYVHVPNGVVVPESFEIPQSEDKTVQSLRKAKERGDFIVAYTGNHSVANGLKTFIDAARLTEQQNILWVLVGSGNQKEELVRYARENNVVNVLFFDPVKKQVMAELLSVVDAAFIGLQKQSLFRFGVSPNKLFDYMLAAKPVIYSVEASNNPVRDADCGISTEAEDALDLSIAARKLSQLSEDELREMGERGRKFVIEKHDYRVLAKEFLTILEKTVQQKRGIGS